MRSSRAASLGFSNSSVDFLPDFEFLAIWSGILQRIARGVKRAPKQHNQIEKQANIEHMRIGFDSATIHNIHFLIL